MYMRSVEHVPASARARAGVNGPLRFVPGLPLTTLMRGKCSGRRTLAGKDALSQDTGAVRGDGDRVLGMGAA
ncbi:hypothetical protein GCM10009799_01510 [Nocardiopsis rhodophaea]|uniref:Uncharacterized protein n=1 Tax=Nocardiopsis rhodophaea TaxID=280238 RepID=A0ABN2S4J7_9ACTN